MTNAAAHDFKEGQVWSYRTRPHEAGSTLLINKIEANSKLGPIFHISLSGLKIKNPRASSGFSDRLPHSPVSQQTLDRSVVALIGNAAPDPAYLEGHATWKKAFDAGQGGIFTITVAEIVDTIEQAINQ